MTIASGVRRNRLAWGHGSQTRDRLRSAAPRASTPAVPSSDCQVIHFIRHAQGWHNLAAKRAKAESKSQAWIAKEVFSNDAFFDAPLTETGWLRTQKLRRHLRQHSFLDEVELVVASPLTRALETACGAFGSEPLTVPATQDDAATPGGGLLEAARVETSSDDPLMKPGQSSLLPECNGFRRPGVALPAGGRPKFIVHDGLRETAAYPFDHRPPISEQQQRFPGVEEWIYKHDEDPFKGLNIKEENQLVVRRVGKVLMMLASRPERRIAVVAHHGSLQAFMYLLARMASKDQRLYLVRPWRRSEMRTVVLPMSRSDVLDQWKAFNYRETEIPTLEETPSAQQTSSAPA